MLQTGKTLEKTFTIWYLLSKLKMFQKTVPIAAQRDLKNMCYSLPIKKQPINERNQQTNLLSIHNIFIKTSRSHFPSGGEHIDMKIALEN